MQLALHDAESKVMTWKEGYGVAGIWMHGVCVLHRSYSLSFAFYVPFFFSVKHHLSCYDLLEHSLSCWPVTHMEQHVAAEWWQLHPLQFPGLAPILTVEMLASEGGDRAQPLPPPVLACAPQSHAGYSALTRQVSCSCCTQPEEVPNGNQSPLLHCKHSTVNLLG